MIERLDFLYIKDHYGQERNVSGAMKKLLKVLYSHDTPPSNYEFAQVLKTAFSQYGITDDKYWERFADYATITVGNLAMAQEFVGEGVDAVKIVAIMDDRTTPICRNMNGRIIPIGKVSAQLDAIFSSKSKDEETLTPNVSLLHNKATADLPDNICLPPYHYGCRTEFVAYFKDFEQIADKNRQYTEQNAYYDDSGQVRKVPEHIIFTTSESLAGFDYGREIVLADENLPHIRKKWHNVTVGEVKHAMEHITEVGEDKEAPGETIALASNGVILIFRGRSIYTAFKPNNAKRYFNDNAKVNI